MCSVNFNKVNYKSLEIFSTKQHKVNLHMLIYTHHINIKLKSDARRKYNETVFYYYFCFWRHFV